MLLAYNIVDKESGVYITLMLDYKNHIVTSDNHHNIGDVLEALRAGDTERLKNLLTPENFKGYVSKAGITVEDSTGIVMYGGQPLHNAITKKISRFYQENVPYEYLVKFLKNIMDNPDEHSRKQLYTFMEANDLPIDQDGNFIAYKRLRNDFTSVNSGKGFVTYPDGTERYEESWHIPNNTGNTVHVERSYVDNNPDSACSYGLHVGSLSYVEGFGSPTDPIVICKVNPKDVVSVPRDCNASKIRCCKYTVVAEYKDLLKVQAYHVEGDKLYQLDNGYSATSRSKVIQAIKSRIEDVKYPRSQVAKTTSDLILKLHKSSGVPIKEVKDILYTTYAYSKLDFNSPRRSSLESILKELE